MPDVFNIGPILGAHQAGTQMRYQAEDRDLAAEERMAQAIAQMAYSANTPERWTQMLGALQRRWPEADLSEFQDFSTREYAIGQGLTLEGQINRDFNERNWNQGQADRATAAAQEAALRTGLTGLIEGQPVPTVNPANPNWMLRGSGATGTNTPPVIDYANQGATRNDPINGQLSNAISAAAAEAGIDRVVVVSGGQEAEGEGGARTGSTRHDHGNAADIDLYVGGRRLDYNNPQDQALFAQFVTAAANNGVTGIGAGEGYMGGNGRIHVGFGAPAVWGAGGSSANAPEWLRTAYNAASRERSGGVPLTDQQRTLVHALIDGNQVDAALQIITQAMQPPAPRPLEEVNGQMVYADVPGDYRTPEAPGEQYGPIITGPDAAAVNLDPALRWQQRLDTGEYQQVGASGVNVTTNVGDQGTPFGRELSQQLGADFVERRQNAQIAANGLQSTFEARRLLDAGMITGFGADFILGFGNALAQIGINIAPEARANTQAFVASRAQEVANIIRLFGAGTGLSDADREFAINAAGGRITLNEESIRRILDINERAARNVIRLYNQDAAQVPANVAPFSLLIEVPEAPTAAPAPAQAPAIRSGSPAPAPNLVAPTPTAPAIDPTLRVGPPTTPAPASVQNMLNEAVRNANVTPAEGMPVTVGGVPYVFHDGRWWQAQ